VTAKDILSDFLSEENDKTELEEQNEKFRTINSEIINKEIINYLRKRFTNLTIEVINKYKGDILELMSLKALEGWCFQTTESALIFLNDNDYLQRGFIKLSEDNNYYHSWICFKYNELEYVFDPSLNIICNKDSYLKVFKPTVLASIKAIDIKNYFINYVTLNKENEVIFHDKDDITSPMYRNNSSYKVKLEDEKILKLIVHYYDNC
jgi:hypothetical protein